MPVCFVCFRAPGALERLTKVILAQNSSAPASLCLKSPASMYFVMLSIQFWGNILFLGVCRQRTPGFGTISASTSKPVKAPKSNLDLAKIDFSYV